MADNSSVPVAVGNETFANNDIAGVKYPRNKVTWGPAGTANDADVATGKPLPVQLRGSDGTDRSNLLPVSMATAPALVASSAIIGKVGIDQTTDGTTNKVAADLRVAGSAVATGSGVNGATVPRFALATDSPGVIAAAVPGTPNITQVMTVQGAAGATPQPVVGVTSVPSTTLTRPATAPTYASGQLFANSATAVSVTNLTWSTAARVSGGSGVVIGAQIQKSGNTVTGAAFRLHLFTVAPTYVTAGDTSPISTVVVGSAKGYLGYIDVPAMVAFSDVSVGSGAPDNSRGGLPFVAAAQSLFGLIEMRGAYVGVASEVLTVFLDILQD